MSDRVEKYSPAYVDEYVRNAVQGFVGDPSGKGYSMFGSVLDGSVQRADQHVRVTAQLIDAIPGRQIWADRYDRESTTSSPFATTSRGPSPEH